MLHTVLYIYFMKKVPQILLLSAFAFFTLVPGAWAENSKKKKEAPQVILVRLNSESNRIATLEARHDKRLPQAIADGEQERQAMINDFRDHFNYCRVYFFMDTCEQAILEKRFNGVLLNADGSTASDLPIGPGSHNYDIVGYGYPTQQYSANEQIKRDSSVYDDQAFSVRGLIIYDDSLNQRSYLYKFDYGLLKKDNRSIYVFASKTFDIEYFPFARFFDKMITRHPKKIPIRKIGVWDIHKALKD